MGAHSDAMGTRVLARGFAPSTRHAYLAWMRSGSLLSPACRSAERAAGCRIGQAGLSDRALALVEACLAGLGRVGEELLLHARKPHAAADSSSSR